MHSLRHSLILLASTLGFTASARADLVTALPGPDDQGGMLMPMVTIQAASGTGSNPTSGAVHISFAPSSTPALKSLQDWSPGAWFAEGAAWRADLGSPLGVGGTPASGAGSGDLFNNQYGFTFMSMGTAMMAAVPAGKSLAIRLVSLSSPALESYNYGGVANRWDRVFSSPGAQVLWSGSMWHNYFTLPADAPAGAYTATFEVFVALTSFTGVTGFAQYDDAAFAALADANFTPASVTYSWTVASVPEPAAAALLLGLAALGLGAGRRARRVGA